MVTKAPKRDLNWKLLRSGLNGSKTKMAAILILFVIVTTPQQIILANSQFPMTENFSNFVKLYIRNKIRIAAKMGKILDKNLFI